MSRLDRSIWTSNQYLLLLGSCHGVWPQYFSHKLGTFPQSNWRTNSKICKPPWFGREAQMLHWHAQMGSTNGLWYTAVKASKCKLNPGVLDSSGKQIAYPSRIWVDGTLIAATGIFSMKMDIKHRQCPLAMDKWTTLVVAEHQLSLGLILDTIKLLVVITREYLDETLNIVQTTWHKCRNRFCAIEPSKIVGKFSRLTEGAPWARYALSQFYLPLHLY